MNLNATLFFQVIVFFVLVWFTMKFIWPPLIKAIDDRRQKIADGLAAADKGKADLAQAQSRIAEIETAAKTETEGEEKPAAKKTAAKKSAAKKTAAKKPAAKKTAEKKTATKKTTAKKTTKKKEA